MIFPGGMYIYFELQYDPISLQRSNHTEFMTYLVAYHGLTQALVQAFDYLDQKNVLKKTWSDRLTAALKRREQIYEMGQLINTDQMY